MGKIWGALALSIGLAVASGAAAEWRATRNAWGHPSLEGAWTNATLTPQARPAEFGDRLVMTATEVARIEAASEAQIAAGNRATDPDAPPATDGTVGGYNRGFLDPGTKVMRVAGEPRTSLITTPDGQVPPPRPGAPVGADQMRALTLATPYRLDEFGSVAGLDSTEGAKERYDDPEALSLGERCLTAFGRNGPPPMFPNGFYNNNYQIAQGPDSILIIVEMVHDQRHIRLGARKHLPDHMRPWFGDSIGWWEGETLVVETTNLPEAQALFGSWKQLKVTERFTRSAPDRLHYAFKVEDPEIWAEPWGGEYEFAALQGRLYEYACHEGNYSLPGILGGTRQSDRQAAADAASQTRPAMGKSGR